MEARHVREMVRATAYVIGDRRDWPLCCAWCESEDVITDHVNCRLNCRTCGRLTSLHVAHHLRDERARKEVMSGVGGPLVEVCEQKNRRRRHA